MLFVLTSFLPFPPPVRVVGFFYDDDYVGEKPDDRLKRSPVTSRPFNKSQGVDDDGA